MKVLVTGGFGFLGRHLVRELVNESAVKTIYAVARQSYMTNPLDAYVSAFSVWCDLSVERDVRKLLVETKPDVIFHLAANPTIKTNSANPCALSRENILPTHYLLEHCQLDTRFVLASSAAVYGNLAMFSASEWMGSKPNSVYGATKVACEALVNAYTEQGKVRGVALRYVANVGKWATHGLVKDILTKLRSSSPTLDLLGDNPGSLKPYAYAGDTATATVRLGTTLAVDGVVNLSTDDQLTVEQVANIVMLNSDIFKPIRWLGENANWKGDNRTVRVSPMVSRCLGLDPRFPKSADAVAFGIREMIANGE